MRNKNHIFNIIESIYSKIRCILDLDGKFKIDENIVQMIHYLEQNPQVKNLVKDNGYNYITSKYKLENIGNMWLNYIENLSKH